MLIFSVAGGLESNLSALAKMSVIGRVRGFQKRCQSGNMLHGLFPVQVKLASTYPSSKMSADHVLTSSACTAIGARGSYDTAGHV
jgi:hypothetical protein